MTYIGLVLAHSTYVLQGFWPTIGDALNHLFVFGSYLNWIWMGD